MNRAFNSMHSFFPLFTYRSPLEVWETEPTYLFGEISLLLLTLVLVAVVARQGRAFAFVCLASFTGGSLIELLTIMEPEIGNFYHSQASLMLFGKREPAYMLVCEFA
ncbi:MAG: hypothetical protein JSS07_12620 [Proteobacteria bacterium]|nr:hypothetical protein [Pseudomonadota bacterium]